MMIRSPAIVAALCLFGTSASALTMEECRASIKPRKPPEGPPLSGLIFRKSVAALTPRPLRRNQPLPRSIDVRPPQLAVSLFVDVIPCRLLALFGRAAAVSRCPPLGGEQNLN